MNITLKIRSLIFKTVLLFMSINNNYAFAIESDNQELQEVIKFCDDDKEWPPYAYFERKNNKLTSNVIGYTVDLLKYIMETSKMNYQIEMNPWSRCLYNVKNAKNNYYVMLQLAKNEEREKDFIFSNSIYSTTGAVFYMKDKIKEKITTSNDLKKYVGCGIANYSYVEWGFEAKELDVGANSILQMVNKIKHNRCDFFLERLEIAYGFQLIGEVEIFNNSKIGYMVLEDVKKPLFYMGISKKYPKNKQLLKIINNGIERAEKTGYLKILEQKWLPKKQN